VKPIELTEISWYDKASQQVIVEISEKVTVSFTLEEFSYLFHDLKETRLSLIEISEIKIGKSVYDGEIIEELIVVTESEEYN
jgi:hypothetical protein